MNFNHLEREKQKSYSPPHGCQARKLSFQHCGFKGSLCLVTKQKELHGDPALAAWKDFQLSFLQLQSEHPLDQRTVQSPRLACEAELVCSLFVSNAKMWGQAQHFSSIYASSSHSTKSSLHSTCSWKHRIPSVSMAGGWNKVFYKVSSNPAIL